MVQQTNIQIPTENACNQITNLPNIKPMSTAVYIILSLITLEIFPVIWFCANFKKFNKLNPEPSKKIRLFSIIVLVFLCILSFLAYLMLMTTEESRSNIAATVLWLQEIALTMTVLKQIEQFALTKYRKKIKHNGLMAVLFTFIYLNFALNSFVERTSKATIANNQQG